MTDKPLLPVAEARARVLAKAPAAPHIEQVSLHEAVGRTLAADIKALRTQPPKDVSAMDGYALRAQDGATLPAEFKVIGTSSAGHGFVGTVGKGEAVRIFTGAPVPLGADAIVIQETVSAHGATISLQEPAVLAKHIREAGIDFTAGDVILKAGVRLGASELALAAAMNHASLPVAKRPRVAILSTGDELIPPGANPGPDQIVSSNSFAIHALVAQAGGEPIDLGIAGDDFASLEAAITNARDLKVDVLVTIGGASVGDHDLVQTALAREGMELGFWKIAMRPGKPLIHGSLGAMSILGFPGNPVSAIVCGHLFLVPLIRAFCGDPNASAMPLKPALLGESLKANDGRADFMRAELEPNKYGLPFVRPYAVQDSSLLSVLAKSQGLLVREPHAPPASIGDLCFIIPINNGN